jgi:WS/DGAT/MGAT family acyltransferase
MTAHFVEELIAAAEHERISRIDTAWLRMDRPGNSMMILSVTITATPVDPGEFEQRIRQRFLCFPRFRSRPVRDALGASWVEDTDFRLERHVTTVTLDGEAGKAELEALTARLAAAPLEADRPLWQIHLIEDYLGGSAWITRMHHCYADGVALTRVLLAMTEREPGLTEATEPTGDADEIPEHPGELQHLLDWVGEVTQPAGDILESLLDEGAKLLEGGIHGVFHPGETVAMAAHASGMAGEFARILALPDDPDTPLKGQLTGVKRVAWARPIPLHEVKTIGKATGCTVNDVLMSTAAGAIGGYLREQDVDTAGLEIRASVPVNLRAADEPHTLGNKFGLVFVSLPVGQRNPLQRLLGMNQTMDSLKKSLQPEMTLQVLGLLGLLPATLQTLAVETLSRKSSVVASNVPGAQAPIYMCGQQISEMYFWVPQSGSIGVGISILSYAGQVCFGVISDTGLIAEPHALVDRFEPEFEKLLLGVMMGALATRDEAARTDPSPTVPARKKRARRTKASK